MGYESLEKDSLITLQYALKKKMKGKASLSDLEKVTRDMREYKCKDTTVEIKNDRLYIDGHPICDLKEE